MKNSLFITGTNTGIGKTLVSALLMAAASAQGLPLNYFKPIQTGEDCDSSTVAALTGLTKQIIKPVFSFKLAAAPYRAAVAENRPIDIALIQHTLNNVTTACIVEGAGGLLVPLTKQLLIKDLITHLKLPVVIIASTQLGTINHTLLTIAAARNAHIPIKGVILSGPKDPGLAATLQMFSEVPILAEIPPLEMPVVSTAAFTQLASSFFNPALLNTLFT